MIYHWVNVTSTKEKITSAERVVDFLHSMWQKLLFDGVHERATHIVFVCLTDWRYKIEDLKAQYSEEQALPEEFGYMEIGY